MRLMRTLSIVILLAAAVLPVVAAQQPTAAQDEFVPMSEVPLDEQLPAAPLLVGAYAFVWVAFIGYAWSVTRRIRLVEADLVRLERRPR